MATGRYLLPWEPASTAGRMGRMQSVSMVNSPATKAITNDGVWTTTIEMLFYNASLSTFARFPVMVTVRASFSWVTSYRLNPLVRLLEVFVSYWVVRTSSPGNK
jgi:hypothetical protein